MKNLDISYRLQKIAARVTYRTLLDVGTDHAYLPICLCKKGKIDFAVASDINIGPLQKAKLNIENHRLTDKIETRLGSGLSTVSDEEHPKIETLVMAGMGGMLTIHLLNDNLKKAMSFKQLLLQPQRDLKEVRTFLIENGFTIRDEEMLVEDGKYYNILDCAAGQSEPYTEAEYYFGRALICKKDAVLKNYLDKETFKTAEILENLYPQDGQERILKRIKELEEYMKLCREVLECL